MNETGNIITLASRRRCNAPPAVVWLVTPEGLFRIDDQHYAASLFEAAMVANSSMDTPSIPRAEAAETIACQYLGGMLLRCFQTAASPTYTSTSTAKSAMDGHLFMISE